MKFIVFVKVLLLVTTQGQCAPRQPPWTPLTSALVDKTVLVDVSGLALFEAARTGELAVVTQELASGADVHWVNQARSGYTSLHIAAANDHVDVVEVLLAAGADKDTQDAEGATPIYRASLLGSSNSVRILLSHGASVSIANNNGVTPLHAGAYVNYPDIVQQLLSAGADPTAQDGRGQTPADMARDWGYNDLADSIDNFSGSAA